MESTADRFERDQDGFRLFKSKFILIASSGDMHKERVFAEQVIQEMLLELQRTEVVAYSWDVQAGIEGLDPRYTMQRSIPNPAHANCLGVFYIVGERIGLPLEQGFDPKHLGSSQEWQTGPYPMELDWPAQPEAINARLDRGAFPLTGGVFEFLAARGHGKPTWIALRADSGIQPGQPDVALNRSHWYTHNTHKLSPADKSQWNALHCLPQTRAVHNFMRACATRGITQNASMDLADLRRSIRQFLNHVFPAGRGNPYRELRRYDVDDGEHFRGRSDVSGGICDLLDAGFQAGQAPIIVRLTGWSGSGKSSVLRCGIPRKLGETRRPGQYRFAVLHPQEHFSTLAGEFTGALDAALIELEVQAGVKLDGLERRAILHAGSAASERAAAAIGRALALDAAPTGSTDRRLIIALDQFEEIVDELSSPLRREYWEPLLQLLDALLRRPDVALVYTLENSRIEQHDALDLPAAFRQAKERSLDEANGDATLSKIIAQPFAHTGYRLANEVVEELIKNFKKLSNTDSHAARNSVLPLLSLKLYDLWEFVSANFERDEDDDMRTGDEFASARRSGITPEALQERGQSLDFEKVIDEQARRAAARAGHKDIDDEALDYFLQPLVGIEGGKLQLTAAPRRPPFADEVRLVDSFRRHRLLVDVGPQTVRIVHEAVLEHWVKARDWLSRRRGILELKARMRLDALVWARDGYKLGPPSRVTIANAAEILHTYFRAWSHQEEDVHPEDRRLRAYCLAVFDHSTTPCEPAVLQPEKKSSHVNLAAQYGRLQLMQRFRKRTPACLHDLHTQAPDSTRPLVSASWWQPDMVRYLLKAGADPELPSADGWPPVAAAITQGRKDIFDLLMAASQRLKRSGTLESRLPCPDGQSLTHYAAWHGRTEMLRDLLDHYGFRADCKDEAGYLPIHRATAGGHLDAFELLRHYADTHGAGCGIHAMVEPYNWNCLHLAAGAGSAQILDHVLGLPASQPLLAQTDAQKYSPLHYAAAEHRTGCITLLLRRRFDPNAVCDGGNSPIHLLLESSTDTDDEAVRDALRALLEDPRTDPNITDAQHRRPLALAAKKVDLQRLLLENPRLDLSLTIDQHGDAAIFVAARLPVWTAVERYVKQYGLPEGTQRDSQGNTFLHHLTARSAPRHLLYDRVTEISAEQLQTRNKQGDTPFHRALKAGSWTLAQRMLGSGKLSLHEDPLLNAELLVVLDKKGPPQMLRELTDHIGARIGRADASGWTVLHYLCAALPPEKLCPLRSVLGDESLWTQQDRNGRRPIDIGGPALRSIAPAGFEPQPWPQGGAWDAKLAWLAVEAAQAAALLARAALPGVDGTDWQVDRSLPAFYQDLTIVRVRHRNEAQTRPAYYFLQTQPSIHATPAMSGGPPLVRLSGSSPPIHGMNFRHLRLDASNVVDYLKFFCFFVRGEAGPFWLLDDAAAVHLSAGTTPDDRERIRGAARPVWLIDRTPEHHRIAAAVFYGNAVFAAFFKIKQDGMVEMEEEFSLVKNLSGRVDMPIA